MASSRSTCSRGTYAASFKVRRQQIYTFLKLVIMLFFSSESWAFHNAEVRIDRNNIHQHNFRSWTAIDIYGKPSITTIRSKKSMNTGRLLTMKSDERQSSNSDSQRRTLLQRIRRRQTPKTKKMPRQGPELSGMTVTTPVPHAGRHFSPSHPNYRRPLVRRIFSKLKPRRRFMEGWYYRLTLKDYRVEGDNNVQHERKAASFAFIISIEDAGIKSSNLRLACLQAIGPNDQYLVQATKDDTTFWGDKNQQSLGCTFEQNCNPNTNNCVGRLTQAEWKESVKSGFQITDDSLSRGTDTAKYSKWPRWMGRICGHDGSAGGVLEGQGVPGMLEFDFEVDPYSICGYGGYTSEVTEFNATTSYTMNSTQGNDEAFLTAHVEMTTGEIRRGGEYKSQRQLSTGGWLSKFPIFEPHWQVTMSDALATGSVNWNGTKYAFKDQPFYAEKNWGDALPSKWYWTQCNSFDNVDGELSVTAGGGIRKLPFGKEEELGMIAVHHKGRFYEAVPWKGNVEWNVSTWGEWTLYGDRLEETKNYDSGSTTPASTTPPFAVEIRYRCEPKELPGLVFRAPTPKQGMVPFCRDTFEADCELTLWELRRNENTNEYEKIEPPIIDRAISREGGAEVGGGPWWETWRGKSRLKPVIKTLLNVPSRFFPYGI